MGDIRRPDNGRGVYHKRRRDVPNHHRNTVRTASHAARLFALWPFGGEVVSTPEATGCLSTLLNVIWIFIGGIWIALSHLALGVFFCITIIGIPFGLQHFKLMSYALVPFGRTVVRR